MRLLELLWLVMVIRIRNTRLEMIKVKMVIVKGGVLEDLFLFFFYSMWPLSSWLIWETVSSSHLSATRARTAAKASPSKAWRRSLISRSWSG